MNRLCLNAIVKNEQHTLARCLRSVKPFIASYVICDTGSTDRTKAIITEELQGIPGITHDTTFVNFSQARNEALDFCRKSPFDFNYILLTDADMELKGTLTQALTAPGYFVRQDGVGLSYQNIRLVRRDVPAKYHCPTHEYLAVENAKLLEGIYFLDHECGSSRPHKLTRDTELLEAELQRVPGDPRSLFYLAQTYRSLGRRTEAIELYRQRVAAGGWEEEVWYSLYMIGVCLKEMDDPSCIQAFLRAYNYRPTRAESLHGIAQYSRLKGQNDVAMLFCEQARAVKRSDDILFVSPGCYGGVAIQEEESICGYYSPLPSRKEAGRKVCNELAVDRSASQSLLECARRNLVFYVQSAENTFGRCKVTELSVQADKGFRPATASITEHQGKLVGLVRTHNYSYTDEGQFVARDGTGIIRTRNLFVEFGDDLQVLTQHEVEDHAPEPPVVRDALVRGFEDCRLISFQGNLYASCTVMDRISPWQCEWALLDLDQQHNVSRIRINKTVAPTLRQKNWMPCIADDRLMFIYSTYPTTVVQFRFDVGQPEIVQINEAPLALDHVKGGSQLVRLDDGGWLCVVHETIERPMARRPYLSRFVRFDEQFRLIACSDLFYFHKNDVEFAAGLVRRNGSLFVSYSTDDAESRSWITQLNEVDVLDRLVHTSPSLPTSITPELAVLTPAPAQRTLASSVPRSELWINGYTHPYTGFATIVEHLTKELEAMGVIVHLGESPPEKWTIVANPLCWAVDYPINERTVVLTTWDSDTIQPEYAIALRKAARVLTTSNWVTEAICRAGLTNVHTLRMGHDPTLYFDNGSWPATCVFGATQNELDVIAEAFRIAFPRGDEPAQLRLRTGFKQWAAKVETKDPRISIEDGWCSNVELAAWYRSLTALVNGSQGEGFGFGPFEAMACGRPVVMGAYAGVTDYFNKDVGYSVEYRDIPATGRYIGKCYQVTPEAFAQGMRKVFHQQNEARVLGKRAAGRVKSWTWGQSARQLMAHLRQVGCCVEGSV